MLKRFILGFTLLFHVYSPAVAHELSDFTFFDPTLTIQLVASIPCLHNQPFTIGNAGLGDGSLITLQRLDLDDVRNENLLLKVHPDGTTEPIVSFLFITNNFEFVGLNSDPERGELWLKFATGGGSPCLSTHVTQIWMISGLPKNPKKEK